MIDSFAKDLPSVGTVLGPVASPGVPLALRLSPCVQLGCSAKGGPKARAVRREGADEGEEASAQAEAGACAAAAAVRT